MAHQRSGRIVPSRREQSNQQIRCDHQGFDIGGQHPIMYQQVWWCTQSQDKTDWWHAGKITMKKCSSLVICPNIDRAFKAKENIVGLFVVVEANWLITNATSCNDGKVTFALLACNHYSLNRIRGRNYPQLASSERNNVSLIRPTRGLVENLHRHYRMRWTTDFWKALRENLSSRARMYKWRWEKRWRDRNESTYERRHYSIYCSQGLGRAPTSPPSPEHPEFSLAKP